LQRRNQKQEGRLGERMQDDDEGCAEGFGLRRFSAAFTTGQSREYSIRPACNWAFMTMP